MAVTTPLFADHTRSFAANRYVYPVISRRSRGLSVGVNLNPDKVCNFDCVYCCVDRRTPGDRRPVDLAVLGQELDGLLAAVADGSFWTVPPFDRTPEALRRFNDIAFSGDGEPTTCPEFPAAAALVAARRAAHGLESAKTVVITNATVLDRAPVAAAIDRFLPEDEVWGKLDAGTEGYYQQVDRSKTPLAKVLANLLATGRRRELTIQSLFMTLHGAPPPEAELDAWAGRLSDLRRDGARIRLVQVYTTARATTEAYVGALPRSALDRIADRVRRLGLEAEVYAADG
jgi:wyosine [tRNA(Phe)-imidazoG37] synthetase (radical SAM superfamily)